MQYVPGNDNAERVKRRSTAKSIYVRQLEDRLARVSQKIDHRSGAGSCPSRKLPVLRRHFHLFPFFDEEGNADLQSRLQSGCLGAAARRVGPYRGYSIGKE